MARLVDADALMEQVKAIHKAVDTSEINADYDTGFHSATSQVQGLIAYMPTVDAVEVVRCRDCAVPHNKYTGCPKLNGLVTTPDFYCPFGKRKDGDGNG